MIIYYSVLQDRWVHAEMAHLAMAKVDDTADYDASEWRSHPHHYVKLAHEEDLLAGDYCVITDPSDQSVVGILFKGDYADDDDRHLFPPLKVDELVQLVA